MDNVVAFNSELSGLYETKPPISKAKMASITKSAMRAIKFYKHVVQSVEKFILKCKPEYKVPGLYVIDSIVRQSRHQFGPEKDVFAPRFARNMQETFANLFRCASDDKSRIIRVLNLWQKNNVFAPEVIQPIFDLADPNHPIYQLPPPGLNSTGVGASGSTSLNDMSASSSNGLNVAAAQLDLSGISVGDDKLAGGLPDLSNNNLQQLLNDPNVLRQLQTLQNFQKMKHHQQEDKFKMSDLRLQQEAFEKHLQNVQKNSALPMSGQDVADFNKEVEFVSEEKKIEVINLDGNDSRSPTPDRDRYKRRRSRSRSRSRERLGNRERDRRRRSTSRSRSSRSPRSNRRRSRDRTTRDKEKEREHERERRRKGLPELRKDHLSVCTTTLWVGHLSKLVYQEELSDTFGEYGDIVSIDLIVPRGCAFIVMNRRQDAYKAMQALKNHKLQSRAIMISWAAGKGVKSKEWKDFWDNELGVTYIPWNKLAESTDLESLEEGGMFDEDSMPNWMKLKIEQKKNLKDIDAEQKPALNVVGPTVAAGMPQNLLFGIDTTQPPPGPPPTAGPPPGLMSMLPGQFPMAPPLGAPPRMLGSMGAMQLQGMHMPPNLVHGMPPPPHAMMMPTGILPPNFATMTGGASMPPPLGLPPNAAPFVPPPNAAAAAAPPAVVPPPATANTIAPGAAADDHMDIEMDEDDAPQTQQQQQQQQQAPNFNQPPPMFNATLNNALANIKEAITGNMFSNNLERNRSNNGNNSRWASRVGDEGNDEEQQHRWRENGNAHVMRAIGAGGGPQNMNIPPLDLNHPTQRPDFNDFDNRGGPRRGGGHPGDFFANQMPQNRFNQPANLLQMRIPPPNAFNARMGGPMFMRGQGPNNRQQAPGFFNPRNPFDRDNNRGMGRGGGRGGRGGHGSGPGGRQGGGSGAGNWSDEEAEDGNLFKRRGGGAVGGNRFRDRDNVNNDERHLNNNNRERGGRGRGGRSGERFERSGSGNRGFGGNNSSNRRNSTNEDKATEDGATVAANKSLISDTEDDWDLELEEYDARQSANASASNKPAPLVAAESESNAAKIAAGNDMFEQHITGSSSNNDNNKSSEKNEQNREQSTSDTLSTNEPSEDFAMPAPAANFIRNANEAAEPKEAALPAASTTPLYDELPPPVITKAIESSSTAETVVAATATAATELTEAVTAAAAASEENVAAATTAAE